eukprot:4524041-Amphidinium_carterae.1
MCIRDSSEDRSPDARFPTYVVTSSTLARRCARPTLSSDKPPKQQLVKPPKPKNRTELVNPPAY